MKAKNAKQVKKEVKLANRQTRVVRGSKYGSLWGGFYAGYRKGSALQRNSLKKHSKKKN